MGVETRALPSKASTGPVSPPAPPQASVVLTLWEVPWVPFPSQMS